MRSFSEGPPLDPRVLCVGLAIWEALPVFPADAELTANVLTIIAEAERYEPDFVRLYRAWKRVLGILNRMSSNCEVGPLGVFLIEQLESLPEWPAGR